MADQKQAGPASDALEQFLVLAKSSTGKAAVSLIQTVLGHQKIFVFGELLDHPNVKALDGSEHQQYYDLLKLFCYDTYADYKKRKDKLPEVNAKQLKKLKQLSIVSFAAQSKTLPYKTLMAELDVENIRELEDMIIDCIYAGLIVGKLDQKSLVFEVQQAIGRDIGPKDVEDMMQKLETWLDASDQLMKTLEEKAARADEAHAARAKEKEKLVEERKNTIAAIKLENEERAKKRGNKAPQGMSDEEIAMRMQMGEDFGGPTRGGPPQHGNTRRRGPAQRGMR